MQTNNLGSLLDKGKEHEKKYEWLQAAENYNKAALLTTNAKEYVRAIKIQERSGFSYFMASNQQETFEKFRDLVILAIDAYDKALKLLLSSSKEKKLGKIHSLKAEIILMKSKIEMNPSRKKELIEEWWNLKIEASKIFKEKGEKTSFGKTCNDLLHHTVDHRLWWLDLGKKAHECIVLGEKAILALKDSNDDYELARAYAWTSWYYVRSVWFSLQVEQRKEFGQKSLIYSKKAIELSEKIGNIFLICFAYNSASSVALSYELDPNHALELNEKALKQAIKTKDNWVLGGLEFWSSFITTPILAYREEDPVIQKQIFLKGLNWAKESISHLKIVGSPLNIFPSYRLEVDCLSELASIEPNQKKKNSLLTEAVETGREFLRLSTWQESIFYWTPQVSLINALFQLARNETQVMNRKQILEEALEKVQKISIALEKILPLFFFWRSRTQSFLSLVQNELAKIEPNVQKKIELLRGAVTSMETCFEMISKDSKELSIGWKSGLYGQFHFWFGKILLDLFSQTKEKKILNRAVEIYSASANIHQSTGLLTHAAESYWHIAKLYDKLDDQLKSVNAYKSASENYLKSAQKLPQIEEFCQRHAKYMQAWSEIEQAKYKHFREDYLQAKIHYEKAGKIHGQLDEWSYLSLNYFAWAKIEQAEELSRTEKPKEAIDSFQEAIKYFKTTEINIKPRFKEKQTNEEKDLLNGILKASDFRKKYCQARILMEDAKLLDREGKYLQSSKSYREASKKILTITENIDNEAERKELEYVALLCQAWEKMAVAQETSSAESYLEAAAIFEQAKDFCYTKKASLWVLGNTNFCKGLAAGLAYQMNLDLDEHSKAKSYIKTAATNYSQAGFKNASEYAKATQRLFDAYLYINKAESESDQEIRAKQYQMVENLLQIAAGSFMKAKQPEKTAQVHEILVNVREEKALAVSLNQVMQAPTIASSTLSFSAPSPTSEASVGLEKFEHANIQANLVTTVKQARVGESFCLSVEFVNAGREPALLMRVEDFVPQGFVVVKKPEIYRIEETTLNMKGKQIAPLKLVEVKLTLQPSKKGEYKLNPKVHYLDELGKSKSLQLKTVEINVEEVFIEDRVSTGTPELDSLMFGGIPKEYAVVLTGSPSDEREIIVNNFLEAGTKEGQTSFYVTTEAVGLENLLEKSGFYLFLCNPKPKVDVPDLPNVNKLLGKTDLTNLNIALLKAYRSVEQSSNKRVCLEIVSDVLLRYGAEATRRWVSELVTDLVSKGFTILAVLDSSMHPSDQANAIINLFDGEINLYQSGDPLECKKSLLIKKLRGQDYIKNPICLAKS